MDICSISCTSTRWHWLLCQISTGHLYSCSAKLRNVTVAKWNITFNISFFDLGFSEMQQKCKKSLPLSGFGLSQPLSFRATVSWEFLQEERGYFVFPFQSLSGEDKIRLTYIPVYIVLQKARSTGASLAFYLMFLPQIQTSIVFLWIT